MTIKLTNAVEEYINRKYDYILTNRYASFKAYQNNYFEILIIEDEGVVVINPLY